MNWSWATIYTRQKLRANVFLTHPRNFWDGCGMCSFRILQAQRRAAKSIGVKDKRFSTGGAIRDRPANRAKNLAVSAFFFDFCTAKGEYCSVGRASFGVRESPGSISSAHVVHRNGAKTSCDNTGLPLPSRRAGVEAEKKAEKAEQPRGGYAARCNDGTTVRRPKRSIGFEQPTGTRE